MADTQVERNDAAMDQMAEEGRVTDDVMAHLTTGEIVVPLHIAQNKQALAMLTMMFELAGADIEEFTVGNAKNKINPETGHPEFWGGFIGSLVSAPIAAVKSVVNDTVSTVVNVAKDVITLNPVQAVKDTVSGAKTVVNDVKTGAVKTIASGLDAIGLLPKPSAPPPPGPTAPTTVTETTDQRNQTIVDQTAVAGGGSGSMTNRTVSGPDNDYKLNKNAVLGL